MKPVDIVRLFALAALWGGSFLLYRIVSPALGAIVAAEARVAIAGVALLAWQALARPRFAWRGDARPMFVVGFFNSALPFALFGFAAYALPAAYLATFNALSPLFGVLVARAMFGEPIGGRRVAGIALGLVGVGALVGLGPVAADRDALLACVACLVAAASYGFAGNYTRYSARSLATPIAPTTMATGSQLTAALLLVPLLPFAPPKAMPSTNIVAATVVLAIACTSIAYLLYFRLIRDVGATRALTVTFLIPLFAIAWAWVVLGEVPTWRMGIGAGLVLFATWLITAKSSRET